MGNSYQASYHNHYVDLVLGYHMFTKFMHSGALIASVLVVSRLLYLIMMLSLTGGKHGTVHVHCTVGCHILHTHHQLIMPLWEPIMYAIL